MKFSVDYFFSKCDITRRKLQIWSDLLKRLPMETPDSLFSFITFREFLRKILSICQQKQKLTIFFKEAVTTDHL